MRGIVVVGIALIVLGVVALAWQGITYTSKEKVVDVGPLKVEAERQKTIRRRRRRGSRAGRRGRPALLTTPPSKSLRARGASRLP